MHGTCQELRLVDSGPERLQLVYVDYNKQQLDHLAIVTIKRSAGESPQGDNDDRDAFKDALMRVVVARHNIRFPVHLFV